MKAKMETNPGSHNSGDCNSGDWNSCDGSNGIFCSNEDSDIRIFNMPSGMSLREFRKSEFYIALLSAPFHLTEWIDGYLKKYSYKEACARWWGEMSEENRRIVKSIPNFDATVFEDITGIKV